MKPGRELDALVAQKVMGIVIPPDADVQYLETCIDLPHYSTDIAAAWEVVEKFKWAEPEISWSDEQHCWHAIFWKGRISGQTTSGTTAPHAICLAALRTVGFAVEVTK